LVEYEITRRKLAAIIVLCLLLPVVVISSLDYAATIYHVDPGFHVNVFVTIEQAGGIGGEVKVGNIIVNGGRNHTRDALTNDATVAAVKYIAIGTFSGTPTKVNTTMTSEYDRQVGTIDKWEKDSLDDYGFNVTKKFTIADDSTTLDCAGAAWGTTGKMYAMAKFDSTVFNTGDNCTILWVFTHDYS